MTHRLSALLFSLLLGGCAPSPMVVDALYLAGGIASDVVFFDDCDEEGGRAQVWIANYTRVPLELVTDVVLHTDPPVTENHDRGFTVVREPIGGGEHSIQLRQHCAVMVGCRPPTDREVEMAFLYYVRYGEDLVRGLPFAPDE